MVSNLNFQSNCRSLKFCRGVTESPQLNPKNVQNLKVKLLECTKWKDIYVKRKVHGYTPLNKMESELWEYDSVVRTQIHSSEGKICTSRAKIGGKSVSSWWVDKATKNKQKRDYFGERGKGEVLCTDQIWEKTTNQEWCWWRPCSVKKPGTKTS